jgi:FkbM family methyltransferase
MRALRYSRIKSIFNRYRAKNSRSSRPSFSECGEDLITSTLMDMMQLTRWTFVDIGANHPIKGNNFYSQYLMSGFRGINIEPNPILFKDLEFIRSKDRNIDSVITVGDELVKAFYLNLNSKISSTRFNSEAVEKLIKTINSRDLVEITKSFVLPWVLKIDIEGEDIIVLEDLLVNGAHPDLIVIETFQGIQGSFLGHEMLKDALSDQYVLVSMTPLNNFYAKTSSWIFKR